MELHSKRRLLALPKSIELIVTNKLAYIGMELITALKSFTVQAPALNRG
jgi:hypothetical protein